MVTWLRDVFPNLGDHQVTSPEDKRYNCVAWAAGDTRNWWWPISDSNEAYWPAGSSREESLAGFRDVFASFGYAECADDGLQSGIEKIAIFANAQGVPLHVARQQSNGRWTSKLGELEDIEHCLRDLEGNDYGSVALIMQRAATAARS